MPRFERIRDRLPTLYRPDEGDRSLLTRMLQAFGDRLDALDEEAGTVLQAHWYGFADRRPLHPHFVRRRQLDRLPIVRPGDLVDLADPAEVVTRLQDAADPLSQYLRSQLTPETLALLDASDASNLPPSLPQRLVDALHRLIRSPSLYDEARFVGVALSTETLALVAQGLGGNELVDLNLHLLEEAYPGLIVASQLDHSYLHDLARLGALLALPPWQEPPALRETVEAYRLRIRRIVALYRNGLGTPGALRRMIEAQLPVTLEETPEQRDRAFWLEEFAPLVRRSQFVTVRGEPSDMVGPLMRWSVTNDGLASTLPTVYIQGVTPLAGEIDPTATPVIERYDGGLPRLSLAYDDTVAPDITLRLRPAFASWIARDNGVSRYRSRPTENAPADPTAPGGPWRRVTGTPNAAVAALHQVSDRALWVAVNDDGQGQLWRYDGRTWTMALDGLPLLHCLAENGHDLLIGTQDGLRRMPLYPADDALFEATPVPGLEAHVVHALLYAENHWWFGTSKGIVRLASGDTAAQPFGLHESFGTEDDNTGVEVYAISRDRAGIYYFGNALGLFQYQPQFDHWYWFAGGTASDEEREWSPFLLSDDGVPEALPKADAVFLPPVRAVRRSADTSLWLGTDHGIARYLARSVQGLTYETVLEAFPDLTKGPVTAIEEDARRLIWFCTDRGLLRYDGRDLAQLRTDTWVQMGAAANVYDPLPQPRGTWRFDRNSSAWQRFENGEWIAFNDSPRTTNPATVRAIIWTDQVEADRGTWDGTTFVHQSGVSQAKLHARFKPHDDVIVEGGLPAVPRLPVGDSVWRYLALEPVDLAEPPPEDRPSWTIEGRLWPPPDLPAPWPGRYDLVEPPPESIYNDAVFAFKPAARVWFSWEAQRPLTVLARLVKRFPLERIDPAIIDRVWQGMQQVRPAGVRTMLAIEETIVRGKENGNT